MKTLVLVFRVFCDVTHALDVGNMLVFLKVCKIYYLTKQGGTAGELYTRP